MAHTILYSNQLFYPVQERKLISFPVVDVQKIMTATKAGTKRFTQGSLLYDFWTVLSNKSSDME